MESHPINVEESLRLFKEMGDDIEMKMCYNNTFNALYYRHSEFSSGEWKVAYGYVSAIEGLLARHCFIVNDKGEAIDPTLARSSDGLVGRDYLSFKIVETEEYRELLFKHDYEPALFRAFRNEEKKAFEWASENNQILIG